MHEDTIEADLKLARLEEPEEEAEDTVDMVEIGDMVDVRPLRLLRPLSLLLWLWLTAEAAEVTLKSGGCGLAV